MTTAHARNTDPQMSHLAAESVKGITELQTRILQCFEMSENGLTDEELVRLYGRTFYSRYPATDSSLRSRRSDLHHKNELQDTGIKRKTDAGGNSTVWQSFGRFTYE